MMIIYVYTEIANIQLVYVRLTPISVLAVSPVPNLLQGSH